MLIDVLNKVYYRHVTSDSLLVMAVSGKSGFSRSLTDSTMQFDTFEFWLQHLYTWCRPTADTCDQHLWDVAWQLPVTICFDIPQSHCFAKICYWKTWLLVLFFKSVLVTNNVNFNATLSIPLIMLLASVVFVYKQNENVYSVNMFLTVLVLGAIWFVLQHWSLLRC